MGIDIFTNLTLLMFMVSVAEYTIHGSYGYSSNMNGKPQLELSTVMFLWSQ